MSQIITNSITSKSRPCNVNRGQGVTQNQDTMMPIGIETHLRPLQELRSRMVYQTIHYYRPP
ncbi:hypothetical protein PGT21_005822 [Puccinia graminis f. sp. tritici]|uniref:Uncharacterized protein n=1 Tax=Puccinia graminis f. sp. tritici TaxID=56615 RepID=A0A5B0N6H6_PUCGR|nr:hypothetical protein PGT21_005822 [Puccinia graminis f. sp. tritici]